MTTRTLPRSAAPPESLLPLENGDSLTREEFERRYTAMPHLKKAELLRGVVYLQPRVRLKHHGEPHAMLVGCIGTYRLMTPGLLAGDNTTVRLGPEDEPQPDVLLMIPSERGGQASIGPEDYVEGAPELAAEVAASSASYDLHVKLQVYRERGIREYIVWRIYDGAIDWFTLRGDSYEPLQPGSDGILRSEVFPGLWLDPAALIAGDGPRLMAVLQQGIGSPEHAAFVERLRR
ncbi:MAG TPA: Uma2 family endonuclease [Armatimonadota bacterium]|nr:Uma2 family endonuclease [Armatimonadota bacterium]